MSDAFISYRRKPSASLALLLQEKLRNQHNITAYVDTTRTDSTRVQFPERLMGAIADAPIFICLLADTTLESEWVRKEIQQAHRLGKHCIPVFQESYIAPVETDPAIDYLLNFDGVHVFDQKNVFVDEAVAQIAALTAEPRPRRVSRLLLAVIAIGLAIAVGLAALYGFGGDSDGTPTASPTSDSELPTAAETTPPTTQPEALGQSMTAATSPSTTQVASIEDFAAPNDQFSAHVQSAVTSLVFSPEGDRIFSGGRDGTVRLWDAQTRAPITSLVPEGTGLFVEDIALSPDATLVAAALNKGPIHVWDIESGSIHMIFDGGSQINSVDFNSDGTALASAGNDGSVRLWDMASGNQQQVLDGHSGQVLSLAFSHNTNQLISGDSNGNIFIWNLASATRGFEFQIGAAVLDVGFAPDDRSVMAAGGFGDNTVYLWILEGSTANKTTLSGHLDQVRDATFSPDGQILASVSRDQTLRLWAIPSGMPLATWEHETPYWSVAYSPDGRRLIVGDESGFIQLRE